MNVDIYVTAVAGGVPILFVVWGLIEILKRWKTADGEQKITGNILLVLSFVVGLVLGNLYMLYSVAPPEDGWRATFGYWFGNAIYGMGLGILAALFHEALKAIVERSVARALEKYDGP